MKLKLISSLLIIALLSVFVLAPTQAEAKPKNCKCATSSLLTVLIGNGSTLIGHLHIHNIKVQDNQLIAVGNVTGVVVNAEGLITDSFNQVVYAPIKNLKVTVDALNNLNILNIFLGPVILTVQKITVTVGDVTVTIVGQVGTLLGNLIVQVDTLLKTGGSLIEISAVIKKILLLL